MSRCWSRKNLQEIAGHFKGDIGAGILLITITVLCITFLEVEKEKEKSIIDVIRNVCRKTGKKGVGLCTIF